MYRDKSITSPQITDEFVAAFDKALKVIASCNTIEQLETARKYVTAFSNAHKGHYLEEKLSSQLQWRVTLRIKEEEILL
jgi:hypothetical protein